MPDIYKDGIGVWRCLICLREPPCEHIKPKEHAKTLPVKDQWLPLIIGDSQ